MQVRRRPPPSAPVRLCEAPLLTSAPRGDLSPSDWEIRCSLSHGVLGRPAGCRRKTALMCLCCSAVCPVTLWSGGTKLKRVGEATVTSSRSSCSQPWETPLTRPINQVSVLLDAPNGCGFSRPSACREKREDSLTASYKIADQVKIHDRLIFLNPSEE